MHPRPKKGSVAPALITLLAALGLPLMAQGASLYAVDDATNELIVIDGDTGATQSIGVIGFPTVIALAFDTSSGVLFGISRPADFFSADLIAINQQTGAGTFLATIDYFPSNPSLPTGAAINAAFDPMTGAFVAGGGTSLSNFGFYEIDPESGVGSFNQEFSFSATGLSFHPVTGHAFYILSTSLLSIDLFAPLPGPGTQLVGSIPGLLMFAGLDLMAFDQTGDSLFAIVITSGDGTQLATIDSTTAALSVVGGVSSELDSVRGIELIPEILEAPEPRFALTSAIGPLFLLWLARRGARS